MVTPHLPQDLVEEVLSRVPAKSLKRLRSTCKLWNTLFSDRRFTEKHFRQATKESLVLMLRDYKVFSMSVDLNAIAPSVKSMGALDLKVDIAEVFHCDGLLLCTTKDNRLVVWNPCLGETKWIPLGSGNYKNKKHRFALGYVTNKSCHSYKILRFWNVFESVNSVVFEIYEFSSNSWRDFNDVEIAYVIVIPPEAGVTLKGNAYWFAGGLCVLCFDFTTERFKRISIPQFPDHNCLVLSVVREKKLALLHRNVPTREMDIWVASTTDNEWSKSFSMNIQNLYYFPLFTSLLVDEENKVAMCCTSSGFRRPRDNWNMIHIFREDAECCEEMPDETFPESTNTPWWPYIFNYVPSLVQIP